MPALVVARAPRAAVYLPNDALARDAGDFAAAVARVWPRPHAPYFEGDEARRRLVGWLAMKGDLRTNDAAALAQWSLRRLLAHYAPEAPAGVAEAFKRLSRGPWAPHLLGRLVAMLADGQEGAKTLRHAAEITPLQVRVLAALPAELRRGRIAAVLGDPHFAALLAKAVRRVIGNRPEPRLLQRLGQRLERAPTRATLFGWLVEELGLERFAPPPVPPTDWLRPILTVQDIERTALKFRNCLRSRIPWMLRGFAAYYEVLGDEPAVVELLAQNGKGWVIGEVRGHANDPVSAALMQRIRSLMARHGAQSRRQPDYLAIQLAEAAGW